MFGNFFGVLFGRLFGEVQSEEIVPRMACPLNVFSQSNEIDMKSVITAVYMKETACP
jgi:hypothetical protein